MASAVKPDLDLLPGEVALKAWNTSHFFLRIYGVLYLTTERLILIETRSLLFGGTKRSAISLDDIARCSTVAWPIGGVSIRRRDGSTIRFAILSFWSGGDRDAVADINAVLKERRAVHG